MLALHFTTGAISNAILMFHIHFFVFLLLFASFSVVFISFSSRCLGFGNTLAIVVLSINREVYDCICNFAETI